MYDKMCFESINPHLMTLISTFQGDKYWKLDTSGIYPDSSYPRRVGVDGFYGIPPGVESAFMLKNRVYFTKGQNSNQIFCFNLLKVKCSLKT